MDENYPEEVVDLREYINIVKRRRWSILVVTALVIAAALGFSLLQTPQYTAQTKVLVEAIPTEIGTTGLPTINLETQREIAASEPVAALVRDDLGLDRPLDSILRRVSVQGITETEVLSISYTTTDPQLARDAADSFARNYIRFRRDKALETVTADRQAIQQRIQDASDQLTELTQQIESARANENDTLASTLETQRNTLIARLGILQQELDDAQSGATQTSGGQVIEEATLPSEPSSPDYITNALLGVFLGLALGIGVAFLRERLDDRFKGREDVEQVLGAPVLATIPRFRSPRKDSFTVMALASPKGTTSEAYRGLRTNVQFMAADRNSKSILVTSSGAGEGKTVTSTNLAAVLAQAGKRTILVSADLRKPTIEKYFDGLGADAREKGLAEWLSGQSNDLSSLIRDPGVPNLRVFPSGTIPPNPAELLSSARLTELIALLEENSDYVIFDSPPVLAVADAAILASRVGGSLIVIDSSATHRKATEHAGEEIHRVGGTVIGSVLNLFDPSATPYYYGPYYYAADETELTAGNGAATRVDDTTKKSRIKVPFRKS